MIWVIIESNLIKKEESVNRRKFGVKNVVFRDSEESVVIWMINLWWLMILFNGIRKSKFSV